MGVVPISPEMVVWGVGIVAAGALLVGFMLGLWVGERGRRRDIQWWTGLTAAPESLEERGTQIEPGRDRDTEALQRAELSAFRNGLREELRAEGMPVPSDEELTKEAQRLMSSFKVSPEG